MSEAELVNVMAMLVFAWVLTLAVADPAQILAWKPDEPKINEKPCEKD